VVAHRDCAVTPSGRLGIPAAARLASDDLEAMRVRLGHEGLPWDKLACRFGCHPQRHPVVGLYLAPDGCHCYPDQIQALRGQHAIKGQQNNAMTPLIERGEFKSRRKPTAIRLSPNQRAMRSPHV
jgi:hypothetical protein